MFFCNSLSEFLFLFLLYVFLLQCIDISFTGTTVKFTPGLLLGGKLQHNCNILRSIGYYLEPLLILAPFCKKPLQITLKGITNSNDDPTVSRYILLIYITFL